MKARQYGKDAEYMRLLIKQAQDGIIYAHGRADAGKGEPLVLIRVDELQDLLDHVEDLHERFRQLDRLMVPRFMDKAQANKLLNQIYPFIRTAAIPGRTQP